MLVNKINNLTNAVHAALCYYIYGDMKHFAPNHTVVPQRKIEALSIMKLLVSTDLKTDTALLAALTVAIEQQNTPTLLKDAIKPILLRYQEDEAFQKQSKRPRAEALSKADVMEATKPLHRYLAFKHKNERVGLWDKQKTVFGHARGYITPKRIQFLGDTPEKYLNIWLIKRGHFVEIKKIQDDEIVRNEVLVGNVYRLMNGDAAAKLRFVPVPPSDNDIDPMPLIASKWLSDFTLSCDAEIERLEIRKNIHKNQLRYVLALTALGIGDIAFDNFGYVNKSEGSEIHMIDFGESAPGNFHANPTFMIFQNIMETAENEAALTLEIGRLFDLDKPQWVDVQRELKFIATLKEADIENMGAALQVPELAINIAQNLTQIKNAIKRCELIFSDKKRTASDRAAPASPAKLMRFTTGGAGSSAVLSRRSGLTFRFK